MNIFWFIQLNDIIASLDHDHHVQKKFFEWKTEFNLQIYMRRILVKASTFIISIKMPRLKQETKNWNNDFANFF